jgi:hypothetical protein
MRFAAAILLSATCLFVGTDCYSQDPCYRTVRLKPEEKPLTMADLPHRALLKTPPDERRYLVFGDVELILRCGTQEDAAELFAAVRNTSVQMDGATVVEADQHVIRVSWVDGFQPNLAGFRFNFDKPLTAIPIPGQKVLISGTYSSYRREPFQINMTNPSFALQQPRQ